MRQPDAQSSASPLAWVSDWGGMTEMTCVQNYVTNHGFPGWYDESSSSGAISPIGFYDHISVMNYCNTEGRQANWGVLSPGDITGVQALYGPPSSR